MLVLTKFSDAVLVAPVLPTPISNLAPSLQRHVVETVSDSSDAPTDTDDGFFSDPPPADSTDSNPPPTDSTDSDPPSADSPAPASSVPPHASSVPTPNPSHPMVTPAKASIFKPKHRADMASSISHGLLAALHTSADPKGYKMAARSPHWVQAMHRELDALRKNNTFTLVPRPANHNIVGCKWVFRTKYLADGAVDRHKAHLVAQGFSQIPGLDYVTTVKFSLRKSNKFL
ncbi:hypothetical protein LXL04_008074 [Taraxacum kok-saghyz]